MFGPLVLDTTGSYFNNWISFVSFDKVVKPGEIGVCGDEVLPDKRGNSFCRQMFFQIDCFGRHSGSFLIEVGVTEVC